MSRAGSGETTPAPGATQRLLGLGAVRLATVATGLRGWVRQVFHADPEVALFAARVSVWMRWLVGLVAVVELAYRPEFWLATDRQYLFIFLLVPLVVFNGLVHHRLRGRRTITWRWLLSLSAMDVSLITGSVIIGGEFHLFVYVTYFPALALFAAVFASVGLCLLWTTAVTAVYSTVTLGFIGLDLDAGQEKALLARAMAMYGVVLCVSLITRFERSRLQRSAERERELHRQRVQLSQAIHDNAAQSAYMVSMGIDRAIRLAGPDNVELADTLTATSTLSKAAMWELRRPIDEGRLFEGRDLGGVLWSHTETFAQIAAVPAEMHQTGVEPPLSAETRAGLFSIAHNALTNAFLHSQAGRVEVRLEFDADAVRLSVRDDGVGLPDDYATRGRGFRGMTADARRLGGTLIVETGGPSGGTAITCELSHWTLQSEGGRNARTGTDYGDGGGRPSHYEERPAGRT